MSRALLTLDTFEDRRKASNWIAKAPEGTRVEFKAPKRTLPQNDRLWALLTEISEQVTHHGLRLSPDDWKLIFMDALKREVRMVPNIDGNGFVNLGRSSSDLSKDEMSDLMELISEYGARNGVVFKDTAPRSSSAAVKADRALNGLPEGSGAPALASESSSNPSIHLKDFFRKTVSTLKGQGLSIADKDRNLDVMMSGYLDAYGDDEQDQIMSIMRGALAVISGRRTLDQFIQFYSEMLGMDGQRT